MIMLWFFAVIGVLYCASIAVALSIVIAREWEKQKRR